LKVVIALQSMEGSESSQIKNLNLCSEDEQKSYSMEQHEAE